MNGENMAEPIKITIIVQPETGDEILGIKEDFANYCERFGDIVKVDVEPITPDQIRMCL